MPSPLLSYSIGTVPFHSAYQRAIHFVRHGHEFGAANEFDYEQMADAFMAAPIHRDLHEGLRTRRSGDVDRIRCHSVTRHFGVVYNVVTLRTYYIVGISKIRKHGGAAGFVVAECAKVR